MYYEVKDLTYNFQELNPIIFLEDQRWFLILKKTKTPKTLIDLLEFFDYSKGNLMKILRRMEKYNLLTKERKNISGRIHQRCPFQWQITEYGEKYLSYSKTKYKGTQRLLVFRYLLGDSPRTFAKKLDKKKEVLGNWESGCRSMTSIITAEKYMKNILEKNLLLDTNLENMLKNWDKYLINLRNERSIRAKNIDLKKYQEMGRKGGKAGDKKKKRMNLIRGISNQAPNKYERQIIAFFVKNKIEFEFHPIICEECFDFRVGNWIIEVEGKKSLAHEFHKANRLNYKAQKVKNKFKKLKFLVIIPHNVSPEVVKKLSEEYIICSFPKNNLLDKYMKILNIIKKLEKNKDKFSVVDLALKLQENKNAVATRFNKLRKYNLIKKFQKKWQLTNKGLKILKNYNNLQISSLNKCLKGQIEKNHNKNIINLFSMRYWFLNNKSGHVTKSKYLDKSEKLIKNMFNNSNVDYYSQFKIINEIEGYEIERLFDGFVSPNKIIEIKTIDIDSKRAFSNVGGSIYELIGQTLFIKEFKPNYKFYAIILGKNKKIKKLPEQTEVMLKKYVDYIYVDENLEELKYAI